MSIFRRLVLFSSFLAVILAPTLKSVAQTEAGHVALRVSSGTISNNYVRVRTAPRFNAPIIASVLEYDFTLLQANSVRSGGVYWHKILLSEKTGDIGWVANVNNVYLVLGILQFPAGYGVTLRGSPSLNGKGLATLTGPSDFEVIEVLRSGTDQWFKVLVRDLDKITIAYVPNVAKGDLKPAFVTNKGEVQALHAKANETIKFSEACSTGYAHFGYLRSTQPVFRTPEMANDRYLISNQLQPLLLPRGVRVKLNENGGAKSLAVLNGFVPVEVVIPYSYGFKSVPAYIKRTEIKVLDQCLLSGVSRVNALGLHHWGGSEYRSYSLPQRATNIALALGRLDGMDVGSNKEFSFLDSAVFPYELQDFGVSGANTDRDQMGCSPGRIFNSSETSSIQGNCRPFVQGISTSLEPIYAGGICGVSSLIHRSVFATGLPITWYHNHGYYYPSVYGLPDTIYGRDGGVGTEAEVAWDSPRGGGRDWSGYRFANDSHSDLVILTAVWYSLEDEATHATLQFYGHGDSDRAVKVYGVETIDPKFKYKWKRQITYNQAPVRKIAPALKNIETVINGNIRIDQTKTDYYCKLIGGGTASAPVLGGAKVDCKSSQPDYNF